MRYNEKKKKNDGIMKSRVKTRNEKDNLKKQSQLKGEKET